MCTVPVGEQATQAIKACVRDFPDVTGTPPDSLDGGCSKVLVRARHIRLEFPQDGRDIRLGGKVCQDLQLQKYDTVSNMVLLSY